MTRLAGVADLEARRRQALEALEGVGTTIAVCDGPGCSAAGSGKVAAALRRAVADAGLEGSVEVKTTGCHGFCQCAPVVVAYGDGLFIRGATPDQAPAILEAVLNGQHVPEPLTYRHPATDEPIALEGDIPFYAHQERRLLKHASHIDPLQVADYLAVDGYAALARALTEMTPEGVLEEVKQSALRGRGGAGFPTGIKWELCRKAEGDEKYIICNADEGDPGAFMDRALLEGNPHSVIEGMAIGGYAIGASRGIMYIRAEYPLAVRNAALAIEVARDMGLLGEDILGTGFAFDLDIVTGAGAFVCGEETALIASIEGFAGEPRPRPPFPAQSGLFGKPTNINNVETWASVPLIIRHGAPWFSEIGYERSRGTKIFSLVGEVRNTGLVEVPVGMTLNEIVFEVGGGPKPGRTIKAVQTGGPSGGCIPASLFDVRVDYESLAQVGSIMGSGGLIVMDDRTCIVDVARYYLRFLKSESCGKCTPCREGVPRMLELLDRIASGEGSDADIDLLGQLGRTVKGASLCGLGQTAANPVLSSIRHFRHEFDAHIHEKRCPAAVCTALITFTIDAEKCTGCTACARACPQQCIAGERKQVHVIDQARCIKCGACLDTCRFDAVVKE